MSSAPELLPTDTKYSDTPRCRTVRRAVQHAGGIERLALCVGCDAEDVRHWYTGESLPPIVMFLKALDVVALTPVVRVCVIPQQYS